MLDTWSRNLNASFTLKDDFFGVAKLIKNADADKYSYSGYAFWFDSSLTYFFHFPILIGVKMLLFLK